MSTERGGTADQAMWVGLANGVAEFLFERVSIGNLLKPKDITGWKSLLKETLKQGAIEASEEMLTEIANILSDAAIMKENSNFANAVKEYMEKDKLSREEAEQKAFLDCIAQVNWAGAGGWLSGAALGGAKGYYDLGQARKAQNKLDAVKADTSVFDGRILQDLNKARTAFIEFARKHFPATVINIETGREIGISRKGLDKFLSGRIAYEKYASGFHIPELIERAHKVAYAKNEHVEQSESIPTYDYYDSPIEIDGVDYMAHIRVRNTMMGDKYYGHTISEIEDIKIEPSARTSVPAETPAGQPVNAIDDSRHSIPQPPGKVKLQSAPDTAAGLGFQQGLDAGEGRVERMKDALQRGAKTADAAPLETRLRQERGMDQASEATAGFQDEIALEQEPDLTSTDDAEVQKRKHEAEESIKEAIRRGDHPLNIIPERQAIHMTGTAVPGRSVITISMEELQEIAKSKAGSGRIWLKKEALIWDHTEIVDAGKEIGYTVNLEGVIIKTRFIKIHYRNTGIHIVPYSGRLAK